jgi:hypothetical protein
VAGTWRFKFIKNKYKPIPVSVPRVNRMLPSPTTTIPIVRDLATSIKISLGVHMIAGYGKASDWQDDVMAERDPSDSSDVPV